MTNDCESKDEFSIERCDKFGCAHPVKWFGAGGDQGAVYLVRRHGKLIWSVGIDFEIASGAPGERCRRKVPAKGANHFCPGERRRQKVPGCRRKVPTTFVPANAAGKRCPAKGANHFFVPYLENVCSHPTPKETSIFSSNYATDTSLVRLKGMRTRRCIRSEAIYFVTIRTVEERFVLDPYACPDAWILSEGKVLEFDERQVMRERGLVCVEQTRTLADAIAQAERDATHQRPVVHHKTFTDSIPNIIGSCMARGIQKYRVRVYGFVWMSNHGHMLLGATKDDFVDFMGYLNGQIAVNVNRFLGRKHQLWARRYAAAPVLDEAAELEMLGYLLANPQNAGLATSIDEWAGLSSAAFLFKNHKQRFLHFDRTTWYHEGCPDDIAPFLSTTILEQQLLPQLSGLKPKKLRRTLRRMIKAKVQPIESNLPPIRRRLLARTVIPTDRPESSRANPRRRSPQPLCHTTIPALRRRHKEWHREFRTSYEKSSYAYRLGNINVEFPVGSFPPSRYPRAKHPIEAELRFDPMCGNVELAEVLKAPND